MMDQVREWVHNQGCSIISTPNFLRPLLKGTTGDLFWRFVESSSKLCSVFNDSAGIKPC
ncbi:hypothetical protein O77CONTIG1_04504 [Leptolyngbya sp. O-77]|nr:hypothetical protein O77CONTIG1_04504 [Leptolyngbya sp. O-77]